MPVTPTGPRARLALDTILQRPVRGIPAWIIHVMEHCHIERLAGARPGDYVKDPQGVYLAAQVAAGVCFSDQFIPTNPLTMGHAGFDQVKAKSATQGAEQVVVDGITIDSPEAVVEHMERFVFPQLRSQAAGFDEEARTRQILENEQNVQDILGNDILKTGYGFIRFPKFDYSRYGYECYFMAYALYPEVMERHFSLQADLALRNNRAAAAAYIRGGLPPLYRLDHDMADNRGLLVRVETLDRVWLPHFARCLAPVLAAGVKLIWHCDGNLMQLVPRLLEVGIRGFQGFQYEAGMDYPRICRMKTKDGDDLLIIAGVSVTATLPHGRPQDVRREMKWLVDNGPATGLCLGGSSSIAPGVPWENIQAMVEGLAHYREHGRDG